MCAILRNERSISALYGMTIYDPRKIHVTSKQSKSILHLIQCCIYHNSTLCQYSGPSSAPTDRHKAQWLISQPTIKPGEAMRQTFPPLTLQFRALPIFPSTLYTPLQTLPPHPGTPVRTLSRPACRSTGPVPPTSRPLPAPAHLSSSPRPSPARPGAAAMPEMPSGGPCAACRRGRRV